MNARICEDWLTQFVNLHTQRNNPLIFLDCYAQSTTMKVASGQLPSLPSNSCP